MPKVINRHHYKGKSYPVPWLYVGRGTPLGNPLSVAECPNATENLSRYRRWLWGKIKGGDRDVIAALHAIDEDTHLVCSCAPRPCHADVIVKAWEWWRKRATAA